MKYTYTMDDGTDGGVAPPHKVRGTRHESLAPHVAAAAVHDRDKRAAANKGKPVGYGAEISGSDWMEGRELIQMLRFLGPMGWNEISKQLGSSNRGLADAMYRSKHVMKQEHLDNLRRLVAEYPEEKVAQARRAVRAEEERREGRQPSGDLVSEVANRLHVEGGVDLLRGSFEGRVTQEVTKVMRAREIADWIRSRPGGSWEKVARVFGYSGAASVATSLRKGSIGEDRLEQAEQWYARALEKETREFQALADDAARVLAEEASNGSEPDTEAPAVGAVCAPPAAPAGPDPTDSWEAIRLDALALAERVRAMGTQVKLDVQPGLPDSIRKELERTLAALAKQRHDKLIAYIAEELDG